MATTSTDDALAALCECYADECRAAGMQPLDFDCLRDVLTRCAALSLTLQDEDGGPTTWRMALPPIGSHRFYTI